MAGRLYMYYHGGSHNMVRCKDEKRAAEIAGKRPNVVRWEYFENGSRIPVRKKKPQPPQQMSVEQMESIIKNWG